MCNVKLTYRKSWAGDWGSSDMVRFDLGPLLQGQTRIAKLKSAYLLIIGPRFWNVEPSYRNSWAGNLLMWSDLTLGPCFKVKRWFTNFGELSFWWIQICTGSPMRESSIMVIFVVICMYFTCYNLMFDFSVWFTLSTP